LPTELCPPNTSNCLHRTTTTATMPKYK
jgi:hypothetical protein